MISVSIFISIFLLTISITTNRRTIYLLLKSEIVKINNIETEKHKKEKIL